MVSYELYVHNKYVSVLLDEIFSGEESDKQLEVKFHRGGILLGGDVHMYWEVCTGRDT